MDLLQALILAIVEGITEFLPISSTGHMIITASVLKMQSSDFYKLFVVAIQFGAILSVVVLYWKRFFQSIDFYLKLVAGVLPALIIGGLFNKYIEALLENVVVVGITLLLGGIILIFVDKWFIQSENAEEKPIDYPTAIKIGFFQCIAMIPGVSRSAASIIGGMTQKLSRKQAAEFSFFLAVPTMFAATAKSMWDYKEILLNQSENWSILLFGNAVAFIVAMLAIKFFIGFLTKYGFKAFGYYRIILGLIILSLWFSGYNLSL